MKVNAKYYRLKKKNFFSLKFECSTNLAPFFIISQHRAMYLRMNINIAGLCPRVDHLAAQVEQLMHSQSNGGAAAANIDVGALTQDILERVNEARNIILYNVPEPQHASSNIGFNWWYYASRAALI